ncbi:MAG: hypothetical protein K2R98_09725 [Gemmataceae bacterium]|nr:hypothetical protein [Gemmataceae bacterium]
MQKLSDTSPEAEQVLAAVYRRMPPGQKWLRLGEMYRDARVLHAAGMRLRNPQATHREIHEDWMRTHVGFTLTEQIRVPIMDAEPLREVRAVLQVFTNLGIAYALGGSMASSVHGYDRYTRDAEIVVEPFAGKEALVASAFGPNYYVSSSAVAEAVRDRTSFNIINTGTAFKIDVFVQKDQPFEHSAMARRIAMSLPDRPDEPIFLHAPEDVILFKLRWYRLGNEVSEQQWKDVQGVLRTQGGRLDDAYLDRWAAELAVTDLLVGARQETVM